MAQLQAEHKEYVMLERELEYWKANREALTKQHPNKWLLIRGEEVLVVCENYEELVVADRDVNAPLLQYASTQEFAVNLPSVSVATAEHA
jgi:hypothetical protein